MPAAQPGQPPARPDDNFGVLSWNLNGSPGARDALLDALVRPDCPWAVVLAQEWVAPPRRPRRAAGAAQGAQPPPRSPIRVSVQNDLDASRPSGGSCAAAGWMVAATTDSHPVHQRRSAILVRHSHPSDPAWPVAWVGGGDSETVCWAQVKVRDRALGFDRPLLLSNVHATSRLTAAEPLDRLTRAVDTLSELEQVMAVDGAARFVAGGDWNAEPWDDEMTSVASGFGAARSANELLRTVRTRRPAKLFNPSWTLVKTADPKRPAGTYFYNGEAARADRWKVYDQFLLNLDLGQLFCSGGSVELLELLSLHTHFAPGGEPAASPTGDPVSDHVPVALHIMNIAR